MSNESVIQESLSLLNLENEGWTKEQEKQLDSIWKPSGSPITSKTNVFNDINIEKIEESVWSTEWGSDELKHWIWPIVEESIRYIIRDRMEIIQKDRIARKQKTGLNKTLAPIIRNYQNITTQRKKADPIRIKRITQLIEDNRIPSSKPYKQLLKQFSEMEKSHNADSKANPEPDFGWFVYELDNLLERDRIYAAAKIIRSVEAIRRENIQLVAYLVIN